jgi:hypothetical protein
MTALAHAAMAGHASVVRLLLADDRIAADDAPLLDSHLQQQQQQQHDSDANSNRSSTNNSTSRTSAVVVGNGGGGGGGGGASSALLRAAYEGHLSVAELLLADERTPRTRPPVGEGEEALALVDGATNNNRPPLGTVASAAASAGAAARATYDAALRAVKTRRNARFQGLVRAVVVLRRLRLRAALTVYAPGGSGFEAAAASFKVAAAAAVMAI